MRYIDAHCHYQVNTACNWLVNGISPWCKRMVWGNKEAGWGWGDGRRRWEEAHVLQRPAEMFIRSRR